jgi:hypothetical protein
MCGSRERPRLRLVRRRSMTAFTPRSHRSSRVTFVRLALVVPLSVAVPSAGARPAMKPVAPTAVRTARAEPLRVVVARTPRFRVRLYKTSGTYPQVRGNRDPRPVNAALRRGILADQREYAPRARKSAERAGSACYGIYETLVDRRLLSASTVVVSALLPATHLYPCGTEGRGWVAVTARVPSGASVEISDLFLDPSRGLRVLAAAWKVQVRRTQPRIWPCAKASFSSRPTPRSFRHFALTPRGLAIGFHQWPACDRVRGIVPYRVLRRYLSPLGKRLVAGVRRPQ